MSGGTLESRHTHEQRIGAFDETAFGFHFAWEHPPYCVKIEGKKHYLFSFALSGLSNFGPNSKFLRNTFVDSLKTHYFIFIACVVRFNA